MFALWKAHALEEYMLEWVSNAIDWGLYSALLVYLVQLGWLSRHADVEVLGGFEKYDSALSLCRQSELGCNPSVNPDMRTAVQVGARLPGPTALG